MGRPHRTTHSSQDRHSRHGTKERRRPDLNMYSQRPYLGRQRRRRPYFDRNKELRRFHPNDRFLTAVRSASAETKRTGFNDVRKILDRMETNDPCEIILTLGGNVESFKSYLRSSDSRSMNEKMLTVLDKGFKSETTPALLLNVINTIVEADFILHTVKSLKTLFEGRVDTVNQKDNVIDLHTVSAVLRILIRMCALIPSKITFILGIYDLMSDLMETIRSSIKLDKSYPSNSNDQTVKTKPPERDCFFKPDTYTESVHNFSDPVRAKDEHCEQMSCVEELSLVEDLFATLTEYKQRCLSKRVKKEKHSTDCEASQTEDFRDIPVFPRLGDLNGDIKPHLRVNKARGGYDSVDDYLDVQFRLLREDFVEPLREGILSFTGQISGKNKKKIQEIKVYENVQIESFVCGDGLNHVLSFDSSRLKHIRWNMTKRLKYGSLVCLSADNFNTCFFATVVNNDVRFRREGRVHVKFAHDSKQIKLLIGSTFTMIESTAYFEAYRPVLSSLQTITENDLPFQEYIVKCNHDVLLPKYLRRSEKNITFDLTCLLEPDVEKDTQLKYFEIGVGEITQRQLFSDEESKVLKRVNIQQRKWPNEDLLQLDPSQLNALKTALTSEFSVIQGPPGCGKTHIGLQIAKVLLQNKLVWNHEDGTQAQLLVVCYTNHALDQFMEGISSFFAGNILRVGSRSSSENMDKYNLKAIKGTLRKDKAFPFIVHSNRISAQQKVKTFQRVLDLESNKIKSLRENILHEKSLCTEMGRLHVQFMWLKHRRKGNRLPPWLTFLDGSVILEWLGIIDMAKQIQTDIHYTNPIRRGRNVESLLDEQISFENRETMTDQDIPFKRQLEETYQGELKRFKEEHISLDVDVIINLDGKSFTETKKKIVEKERRLLREKIRCLLRETKPMLESEVLSVRDILSSRFTKDKRWALYLFWVQKKCNKMYLDIEEKIDEFQAADDRYREVVMMEDRHIFREADIIGMTVTGAAKHKTILREVKPTIMIVEEAAEVLESHLISNLTSGCEQLILIGDHKQLKPKPNVYRLEREYNLDVSLFERMVRNDIKCDCLQTQHRMRPEIADNVRHIYKFLIDHDSVKQYEPVKGISHNIFFIDHCEEEKKDEELKSYTNEYEANYVIALCNYLLLQGYGASKITILTTYKGQMFMLKRKMLEQDEFLNGVKMTIVDDYQGEENDIILLSLVRSNREGRVGFLKRDNRVCVAISRARKGFYVIGNFEVLSSVSSLWNSIINGMKKNRRVGKALPLCCQNHPNDEGLMAENPLDFRKAPKGGCGKLCDIRLECGHACGIYCHITNKEHKNITCKKSCTRKCINGHQCRKKCWENCVCEEEIIVTLPRCRHTVHCVCTVDLDKYVCNHICKKRLDCGHDCNRMCKDDCICMKQVKVTLPKCGHQTTIPCSVKPEKHKCTEYIEKLRTDCGHLEKHLCRDSSKKTSCKVLCNLFLDCGHVCQAICGKDSSQQLGDQNKNNISRCPRGHFTYCNDYCKETLHCGHACKGKCYSCFQGRWHKPCEEDCNCILMCGHKCKGKCGYCLPCTKGCSRRCCHKFCEEKCIEVCKPCTNPCNWQCNHFRCTKLCGEICDRPRCNKSCKKLLPCGHNCIGMCGDPCPNQCRICNLKEIGQIQFGKKNHPDARFVELQDCGHLIRYDLLDKYMDTDEGLCVKRCPMCRVPVRTTMGNRYENTVNILYRKLNDEKKHKLQDYEFYATLTSSIFKQSDVIEQATRPHNDPIPRSGNSLQSKIFTFFDCRGGLNSLNLMAVNHFVKSVSTENLYPLCNDILLFPHANLLTSQHLNEIERELKRYFDKCQLEKIILLLREQKSVNSKVKEILKTTNDIFCQKRMYSDDDREKVQTCINSLPEIANISKGVLQLSITQADIDRDIIIRDGGIEIRSLYKKDFRTIQSRNLKENHTLKGSFASEEFKDNHDEQMHVKQNFIQTKETTSEDNKILCKDEKSTKNIYAASEVGFENDDTVTVLCEENGHMKKNDYDNGSLPINVDEEPIYILTLLKWSGYPYFHCKQSQFDLENSNFNTSNEKDSSSKRKTSDKNKEPVEKKAKQAYEKHKHRSASKSKRRLDRDDNDPPSKKPKTRETIFKTDTKLQEKKNAGIIFEIKEKSIHSVCGVASDVMDARKSKFNIIGEEGTYSNLSKPKVKASNKMFVTEPEQANVSSRPRELKNYNDIDMFADKSSNQMFNSSPISNARLAKDDQYSTWQIPAEIRQKNTSNVGMLDSRQRIQPKDFNQKEQRFVFDRGVRSNEKINDKAGNFTEKHDTELFSNNAKEISGEEVSGTDERQNEIETAKIILYRHMQKQD